jgi:hypothetical protein
MSRNINKIIGMMKVISDNNTGSSGKILHVVIFIKSAI